MGAFEACRRILKPQSVCPLAVPGGVVVSCKLELEAGGTVLLWNDGGVGAGTKYEPHGSAFCDTLVFLTSV